MGSVCVNSSSEHFEKKIRECQESSPLFLMLVLFGLQLMRNLVAGAGLSVHPNCDREQLLGKQQFIRKNLLLLPTQDLICLVMNLLFVLQKNMMEETLIDSTKFVSKRPRAGYRSIKFMLLMKWVFLFDIYNY